MKTIPVKISTEMFRSRTIILVMGFALFLGACATFEKPTAINETPVHDRALTQEINGIRVSAAVVGSEEARQIFGIDLSSKNIQAVWLDIENNGENSLILLPTAIDTDYFSPLEVAFAFHRSFAKEANTALAEHLLTLNFPIRSAIPPGARTSGYLFTNASKGMKVIDVDLLGKNFSENFTFFALNPDYSPGKEAIERIEGMYSDADLQNIESEDELRHLLEQLPCCVSEKDGTPFGEPLNVVVIGELDDWTTAFVRRGYRYHPLKPRYAFGRTQDISGHKVSRLNKETPLNVMRLWQTPMRYDGKTVWVGQVSNRLGGRFAGETSTEAALSLDPNLDEARDALTQDLAYSQGLIKIGYVQGAGHPQAARTDGPTPDIHYKTDGLRVVLVFTKRPASLADIDFFNWERLSDYR